MARRRANGEGTVGKRRDGRWYATVSYIDDDGTRRRRTLYAKMPNTQREAARLRADLIRQRDQGLLRAANKQTLGEHLEHWITHVAPQKRRSTTIRVYDIMIRQHIIPAIGHVRLDQLQPIHIERLQTRAGVALAAKSVLLLRAVLSASLAVPLKTGVLLRNPVELVEAPRATPFEATVLTGKDAGRLLRAARGHRLEGMFHLALWLGMREGEIIGLRWQDIDWEQRRIHVRVQLERGGRAIRTVELKTKGSRRSVPLTDTIARLLHQRRRDQLEEQLQSGARWVASDLIFAQEDGRGLHGDQCRRALASVLETAGLPHMRFHDLRHACASLLASARVPARLNMAILGHASLAVNQEVYAHVFDTDLPEAIAALEAVIRASDDETAAAIAVNA